MLVRAASSQWAHGPAPRINGAYPNAGWVTEHYKLTEPEVTNGALRVQGDSRVYLVQDYLQTQWENHKYMRLDLRRDPLAFELDLSSVPCGCLACVYMVKMADPTADGSSYCDMAENTRPGLNGEECIEMDVLEANNWAMQTAVHTEQGGTYGSGNCDRNGCERAPHERVALSFLDRRGVNVRVASRQALRAWAVRRRRASCNTATGPTRGSTR